MKNINILGIKLSNIDKKSLLQKIESFLESDEKHYIVTPNPEIILEAIDKDEEFFYILNKASIAIADGFGLKLSAFLQFRNLQRITGADLLIDLLKLAELKKKKVLIVNWHKSLSSNFEISEKIKKEYPRLNFSIINSKKDASDFHFQDKADILLVNFGAPWQEKFIYHNLKKINGLKLAIGIGGAFDFFTGKIKRAPKIFRLLGFEWLWRLVLEPKRRFRRIYRATFVFSYKFFKWQFIKPFLYRRNVVCLLYKKVDNRYKILLVERSHEKGHWQLPQGGTDGEDTEIAGARELREELNCDKFEIKKSYKNLYKYDFDDRLSKFLIPVKKVMGYRGQKQGLILAEFTGSDTDIKINFYDHSDWKWVDSNQLVDEVFEIRKKSAIIFLDKFNKFIN